MSSIEGFLTAAFRTSRASCIAPPRSESTEEPSCDSPDRTAHNVPTVVARRSASVRLPPRETTARLTRVRIDVIWDSSFRLCKALISPGSSNAPASTIFWSIQAVAAALRFARMVIRGRRVARRRRVHASCDHRYSRRGGVPRMRCTPRHASRSTTSQWQGASLLPSQQALKSVQPQRIQVAI